jgi:hypothetical protein
VFGMLDIACRGIYRALRSLPTPRATKCHPTSYCTPYNILRAQVLLQLSTQQAKLIHVCTSCNNHSDILRTTTTRYPTQQPFKLQPPVQCVPVTDLDDINQFNITKYLYLISYIPPQCMLECKQYRSGSWQVGVNLTTFCKYLLA